MSAVEALESPPTPAALPSVVALEDVLKRSKDDEPNMLPPQPPKANAKPNSAAMVVPFRIMSPLCSQGIFWLVSFGRSYSKPSVATPRQGG
jgi:hypothetical protein